MSERDATDRAQRLERIARTLSEAGLHVEAKVVLEHAAARRSAKEFEQAEAEAREFAANAKPNAKRAKVKTFRDVCELFWTGELHRMAPDRVALGAPHSMSSARAQLSLLCESVGDVPLERFTRSTAERAMATVPGTRSKTTRRMYAQRIVHMLNLATLPPLEVIERSPLPPRWAPKRAPRKAYPILYPDEDKQLLRSQDVEIEHRWLWAFLAREGCRVSEALELRWRDLDLERGVINLDRNKTRRPRTWLLCTHVASALREKRRRDGAEVGDRVFHVEFNSDLSARTFRSDLRAAGIKRAELFARTPERSPIRAHDLRGSFVTLALANGWTEAEVQDRTGHTTSAQLNGYRRPARFAEELRIPWWDPMTECLGLVGSGQARDDAEKSSGKPASRRASTSRPESRQTAPDTAFLRQNESLGDQSAVPGPATLVHPGHGRGALDDALAEALRAATAAGEWATVRELAAALERRKGAR